MCSPNRPAILFFPDAVCRMQLSQTDAATLLRLLLLAPVLEEWVIRAGLHAGLLRKGLAAHWTVALAAGAFSLLHAASGWFAMAAVFLPGIALGLLYQWRPDWRICAAAHSAMNALGMTFCSFYMH